MRQKNVIWVAGLVVTVIIIAITAFTLSRHERSIDHHENAEHHQMQ